MIVEVSLFDRRDIMRKVTKGRLGELTFQLNPSNMQYDAGGVWAQINSPGMDKPILSYSYGKPRTFTFELWVNKRHEAPVDMAHVFNTLHKYRLSKEPVIFAYGSFVCKVIVLECPFNIEAWSKNLSITEMKIPVTLQIL
jgi:hypothetical protein